MIRIGCHLSISGGFKEAARSAAKLECEALQVFSRSPRGGEAKPLDPDDVGVWKQTLAANNICPAVIHVPYYVNLAATEPQAQRYTREIIGLDLVRAGELGASYVVTHMGHGQGSDAYNEVVAAIDDIIGYADAGGVLLLIENTAGQGKELGTTFSEIAEVIFRCRNRDRVGLCLDTCHAFGAGYDLTDPEAFDKMVREIRDTVGLDRLKVIHANDSKEACGSHRDRHEHIGEGLIGLTGMRRVMQCECFDGATAILETPLTSFEANLANITRLKSLR